MRLFSFIFIHSAFSSILMSSTLGNLMWKQKEGFFFLDLYHKYFIFYNKECKEITKLVLSKNWLCSILVLWKWLLAVKRVFGRNVEPGMAKGLLTSKRPLFPWESGGKIQWLVFGKSKHPEFRWRASRLLLFEMMRKITSMVEFCHLIHIR